MMIAAVGAIVLGIVMVGVSLYGLWFARQQDAREKVRLRARQKMEAFRQNGSERTHMMDIYTRN